MIFRFTLTWALFAFIALCNANNAYQTAPAPNSNYNDETLVLNNLIPYEKFVEGDIYEPLLYGTHTIQSSVSPYIPVNSYSDSYATDLNSANYQTAPVSYESSKPMPTNFNVYSAKNPTPIQYKPASVYPQPANPVSYPAAYPALPNYQAALPSSPAPYNYHSQVVDYGLHYEQNQSPVIVPTTNYPTNPMAYQQPIVQQPSVYPVAPSYPAPGYSVASYPAAPASHPVAPANYPAASYPVSPARYPIAPANYPAASYPAASYPVIPTYEKPAMSTTKNETDPKPPTDPKKDEPTTPVMNEKPSVKPPTDPKPPVIVDPKPTPSPKPPTPKPPTPKPPVTDPKPPPKKNYTNKFTGYRYIMKPSVRRSLPTNYYRSLPTAPYSQTAPTYSNSNPYPPSTLNYGDSTKLNFDHYKKSSSNQTLDKRSATNSQLAARETTRHPTYASRSVNYNVNYNNQKPYYPAASTGYQIPSTPIYNENNVAEAVLRGYSINADENNNKAIVRLFEESYGAISFDFRICDLKKNIIYSIYIHDYGQLTAGCESSGGQYGGKDTQFNPILGIRSNPIGFIGTFKFNGENLVIQHFTRKLYLKDIIGRNIVIHEITTNTKVLPEAVENNMLNTFSVLLNPLSSPLVSSRKVACGVIGRANPYSFLRPVNPSCEIEVPVVEEKPDPATVKREMQNEDEVKKNNL